jgi:hypothetical protein
MRHRIPLLSTGLVLGLLAMGAGTARAQDTTQPNEKALQKQCLSLAQRDSARDNSNMAAPAPAVSDSIRTLCDSVNAANPDFQKQIEKQNKEKYPDSAKPEKDSTASVQEASPGMTSVTPATPAAPPVTTGDNTAQPATPSSAATSSDPNRPTDSTTTAPPPPPNPNSSTPQ